ncbi:MAG: AsmA-like C-terminal region-containing protein [Blastochloris sp.]|nr:AsmA-like C-terminal region-containing protein [Blastochloris sp.]
MKLTQPKSFVRNKFLWISLALVLLLACLGIFFGPSLLYSNPLFRAWVQSQISDQSKGMFKFENISGGIFSANLETLYLDLDGVTSNVRKVETPQMKASFSLLPLLQNKLSVTSLTMKAGRLNLDLLGGSSAHLALPVAPSFRLENGEVAIANLSGWNLLLSQCNLEARQSGSAESLVISGRFSAATATLGPLKMEKISGEFRQEKGVLHVKELKAILPGKSQLKLNGTYQLDAARNITADLNVDSPDVRSLLQALDYSDRFSGQAQVSAKVEGSFRPKKPSLKGSGQAKLSQIKPQVTLPQFPAFNDAAILKRAASLDKLQGKAEFTLNGDQIQIQSLDLKDDAVRITGTAQVGFNRSLNSQLLLTGNPGVADEIPNIARSAFEKDASGNVLIPFALNPSTRDPQVDVGDVVQKILSNPIKALNPLNIF